MTIASGFLPQIQAVRDVNYLTEEELDTLCAEMRTADGGLGTGVCELAVALHRVFDCPPDRLAVGDASLLRACALLRVPDLVADPDAIGTAIGWAWARDLKGQDHHVVAVDSHSMDRRLRGREKHPLIVVQMRTLTPSRQPSGRLALPTPEFLGRRKRLPAEPVDGRRIGSLLAALEEAKERREQQVIEVLVEPSKRRQEVDPVALSGPIPSFKEVLAHRLFELARAGHKFVWIGPHPGPLGREYPERYVEWEGSAEHTLAVAASMAGDGIPVVAVVRASEIPRVLSLLARRIAGPRLPVTLVVDEDDADLEVASLRVLPGMAIFSPADENDLRALITTAVFEHQPTAICCPRGPGVGIPLTDLSTTEAPAVGAERLSGGRSVAILALGQAVWPAILAAQKLTGYRLDASVINMRSTRPLDEAMLLHLVDEGIRHFITVEEGTVVGGLGASVMDCLHRKGLSSIEVRALGRQESPLSSGPLGAHDPDAIVAGVLSFVPDRVKKRLDVRVAELGLAPSREQAQRLIMAGLVQVDGLRVDKAGTSVSDTATIQVARPLHPYVSRGGLKLAKALETWPIHVPGAVGLDVGASTGGFTHCLLLRGAARVYAIDVGYGQLDYSLRQDARVLSQERVNARYLSDKEVPEEVDIATIDVSFISLTLILPPVMARLKPDGHCVALIKPQFEAGRGQVGKGGVVRNPAVHREVLTRVARFATDSEWQVAGLIPSPIQGPSGNVEFLCWIRKGRGDVPVDLEACLKAVDDDRQNP